MRKVEFLPTRDCEAGYDPGDGVLLFFKAFFLRYRSLSNAR